MLDYKYAVEGDSNIFKYALEKRNIAFKEIDVKVFEVDMHPRDMYMLYDMINRFVTVSQLIEMLKEGDMRGF